MEGAKSPKDKTFYPRIGLEIHMELNTRSKCFCDCKNDPDEIRPNINVCPICMGYPGALPVLNKEAVRSVLKLGIALGSKIANFTEWDRKNYFYPDIPKAYQISQYKHPLVEGGELEGVAITRVHLEEDTARSQHDKGDTSLVDFNRSGVPLMELVTEPVIFDAETAGKFAKSLQLLLQYLGIAEANMEKGEMRVEANISVSTDPSVFGTKVEVKNLNSFRSVERAIAYELKRHEEAILAGEKIVQETRGFDEGKGTTFSQRSKEEAHDYRYFPDPDLPKLFVSEVFDLEEIKSQMPELPWQRKNKFIQSGVKEEDAEIFTRERILGNYFVEVISLVGESKGKDFIQLLSNYVLSDIQAQTKEGTLEEVLTAISKETLIKIGELIKEGKVSSRGAKDLIALLVKNGGGDAEKVAEENGLFQNIDLSFIDSIAQEVISENEKIVTEYKSGKENALQFLIGQGMKKSKGKANPERLKEVLINKLSA